MQKNLEMIGFSWNGQPECLVVKLYEPIELIHVCMAVTGYGQYFQV